MKYALFCLIALLIAPHTQAQTNKLDKPPVILFMLNESLNQMEALKKRGRANDIPLLQETDREINESIIRDFNQFFTFCSVYKIECVLQSKFMFVLNRRKLCELYQITQC